MKRAGARLLLPVLLGIACCLLGLSCGTDTRTPQAGFSDERTPALVREGRDLLEAGEAARAQVLFEEAVELEQGSLDTRMWVLRAWMDQGRSNDTLDALDDLRRAGRAGPAMDYLYGMAFVRRAEGNLALGVTDSSVTMNFEDAVTSLSKAVAADPERYSDAFQPLAKAAWYTLDLERACDAAERAVFFHPDDGRAAMTLGLICMSQFTAAHDAQEDEAWSSEAEGYWSAAHDAFSQTIDVLGAPADSKDQRVLSEAGLQLGHALLWKERREEAADAYAGAIAWSPEAIDYKLLHDLLVPAVEPAASLEGEVAGETGGPTAEEGEEPEPDLTLFRRMLERGSADFRATFGADDPRDAALSWWLGWARHRTGDLAGAEEAFVDCGTKEPTFVNAWFHAGLVRLDAKHLDEALTAFRKAWVADPSVVVASMKEEPAANVARLEALITWAYGEERLLDCALLSEICAETELVEPRHWNNLGFFLRDATDAAAAAEAGEPRAANAPSEAELNESYERAYAAYTRSLALNPDDPQLLNDTALMLHRYLERDLDLALQMYRRASRLAIERLAEDGLSEGDRERFEAALKDARENERALVERIGSPAGEEQQTG